MKLFFTLYNIFSALRISVEKIINFISEKLSEFFEFIVTQYKMTNNFKKNYKLFFEWYSEYKKEKKNEK